MAELLLILLGAALVNNFVLVQFLGLCPFMGASPGVEGALGMALATGLVLTTASGLSYLVERCCCGRSGSQICASSRSSS